MRIPFRSGNRWPEYLLLQKLGAVLSSGAISTAATFELANGKYLTLETGDDPDDLDLVISDRPYYTGRVLGPGGKR